MDFDNILYQKLVSCGQYTEALHDYIKMLISHNKSRQELINDLELFLHAETDSFVDWLIVTVNSLLNGNQDISLAQPEKHLNMESSIIVDNVSNTNDSYNKHLDSNMTNENPNIDSTIQNHTNHINEIEMDDINKVNQQKYEDKSRFNRFLHDIKQAHDSSVNAPHLYQGASGGKATTSFKSTTVESRRRNRMDCYYGSDLRDIINNMRGVRGVKSNDSSDPASIMNNRDKTNTKNISNYGANGPSIMTNNNNTSCMLPQTSSSSIPDSIRINNGRCKFWPNCKNIEECAYYHPILPCMNFPNCKFGNKCLNIHPVCKYNSKCYNAQCPYTHFTRSSSNKTTIGNPSLKNKVDDSSNAMSIDYSYSCQTTNPKPSTSVPCKFGSYCRNKKCIYQHDNSKNVERFDLKQMKYVAPDLLHNKNNID